MASSYSACSRRRTATMLHRSRWRPPPNARPISTRREARSASRNRTDGRSLSAARRLRASALPAKHGRSHLLRGPVEEILMTRPAVNFGIADNAGETAGALALQLLLGRRIVHPATGAGELLECPYAIGHGAIIRAPGVS